MRWDVELRELAARQMGMVSSTQARSLGMRSRDWIRLDAPDWATVTDRVKRLVGVPPSRGDLLAAAVLDQGGDAALSRSSAAWWWGIGGYSPTSPWVVTTSATRYRTQLAQVHKVRALPERWVTVLHGVRVVRPELLVLELCGQGQVQRAERLLDNLWRDRLLSGASIDALLRELGRRGRDGTAALRELRAERSGDYVPPASNLERRGTEVLSGFGIVWRRQVDLGDDQWRGRVDLYGDPLPLIVEVQSEKYHTALLDRVADEKRRAGLERAGFTVVEITEEELWGAPEIAWERVAVAVRRLRAQRQAG